MVAQQFGIGLCAEGRLGQLRGEDLLLHLSVLAEPSRYLLKDSLLLIRRSPPTVDDLSLVPMEQID
jgi:hypothetical protein